MAKNQRRHGLVKHCSPTQRKQLMRLTSRMMRYAKQGKFKGKTMMRLVRKFNAVHATCLRG